MVALVIFIAVLMSAALEYSYHVECLNFTKKVLLIVKLSPKITIHNFRIELIYYATIKRYV